MDAIRAAFLEHIVLTVRDQSVPPAAQIAFTKHFGAVEPHPLGSRPGLPGHPELMVLENRPGRPGARNDFWHSDISHAERPPAVSGASQAARLASTTFATSGNSVCR